MEIRLLPVSRQGKPAARSVIDSAVLPRASPVRLGETGPPVQRKCRATPRVGPLAGVAAMINEPTAFTRREALRLAGTGLAGAALGLAGPLKRSRGVQARVQRQKTVPGVSVVNPRCRVPVSLIIDDSTALANLAHFAIPQFAEVFPDQYKQDWRSLPREIPDAFVRKFADWCGEHHVRGKYSMVPYPACVGWLDRDLPGWSRWALEASLEVVRRELVPAWDIHPEMVSHTWAIDVRTGRPYPERSERFMENWGFSVGKSADELTEYLAYALRILKNAGLRCEGITTPGGFGTRVLEELSLATLASVRDVYNAEIPHYFRHLFTDEQSVAPRVENVSGLESDDPRCVVSIIGCTGDWFGGWDGLEVGHVDQFITADAQSGRLPEIIARGEPAVMVCHWPGIYCNGDEFGFQIFKDIVARLEEHYDNLIWMNLSEISRYWAARELTAIERASDGSRIAFRAPFAGPGFTLQIDGRVPRRVLLEGAGEVRALNPVRGKLALDAGSWTSEGQSTFVCFDLPRGRSALRFEFS
jgi:hypothetical protein